MSATYRTLGELYGPHRVEIPKRAPTLIITNEGWWKLWDGPMQLVGKQVAETRFKLITDSEGKDV